MPGQFPGAAAEIQHTSPGGDVVADRVSKLRQPPGESALWGVFAGPAARLGVEKLAHLFGVG